MKHQMKPTNKQLQELKAAAHHLDPLIQIGRNGLTPEQIQRINSALTHHELVKIRYNDYKNQKETISREITEKTDSHRVDLIGHTLIIYRQNPNKAQRKYIL